MEKGTISSKDVMDGKVKPSEIELRYVILYDTGKLEKLSHAINVMAKEGWAPRGCAGVSGGAFVLLEKT